MINPRARMMLLSWRLFRRVRFKGGDAVVNRYSGSRAILTQYCGPYVGFDDGGKLFISERWATSEGALVAAGYFWLLVSPS